MPTINHLLKRCAISLCLVALMVLSACGPGTGGTGTGPSVASSPIPFTSSYFTSPGAGTATAAPLPNPTATPTTTPTAPPTSTASTPALTCTTACASALNAQAISLHLQADRIVLTTPCATFTYAGVWSLSATGETTVQGVWESSAVANGQASRSSQNASLTLAFPNGVDGSSTVTVSIKDGAGGRLLGPATLQRAASAPVGVGAGGC